MIDRQGQTWENVSVVFLVVSSHQEPTHTRHMCLVLQSGLDGTGEHHYQPGTVEEWPEEGFTWTIWEKSRSHRRIA